MLHAGIHGPQLLFFSRNARVGDPESIRATLDLEVHHTVGGDVTVIHILVKDAIVPEAAEAQQSK